MRTTLTGYPRAETSGPSFFGTKTRSVDEAIERHRDESAAALSLLVELNRLLGPLGTEAIDYASSRLGLDAAEMGALARAHRLAAPAVPPGRLGLCTNGACAARGGSEVERVLREKGIPFEPLRCQGACDLGPIACYNRGPPVAISAARARSLAKADPSEWEDILSVEKPVHAFKTEVRVAFANVFAKGSHQIATARRHDVWAPVEKALKKPAEAVLEAVERSGLVGGELDGRPVIDRWRAIRATGKPAILVIDALDAEPGSSKDRILLERDPHLVLAGAALCAWAVGATDAYLCVRGEYELVLERCRTAIDDAARSGLLGEKILGTPLSLSVLLRQGPNSYFSSDPARLVEGLAGRLPGLPGQLPKLEAEGLFGRPTLVLNAETLGCIPEIVARGGDWYRSLGLDGAVGTKVVSLGGDVKRPGNYEVPRGTCIRQLVDELGEGPLQGKRVIGLQIGGVSEPYLPPEALDVGLDDAQLAPLGGRVGCGSVVVVTEKSCLFDLGRREAAFFARESCRACSDCEPGLSSLVEAIDRLDGTPQSSERFEATVAAMRSSGCKLARKAATPLCSVLASFPEAACEHVAGLCTCFPKRKSRP